MLVVLLWIRHVNAVCNGPDGAERVAESFMQRNAVFSKKNLVLRQTMLRASFFICASMRVRKDQYSLKCSIVSGM